MTVTIREKKHFKYIDEGQGKTVMLLHGLFGALSNWQSVINHFKQHYRVIVPILPIYDMPTRTASLDGLYSFLDDFVNFMQLENIVIIGNSLGGHLGILYALKYQDRVDQLILTGSSGLFEDTTKGTYPRRGSYNFVKERVEYTFYNPKIASKELVDMAFDIVSDISKCINIVRIARSAQKSNLTNELPSLTMPTLLVWGLNDTITPPIVAHEFNRLIPNSELKFIDHCCHVPMMEHPQKFNKTVDHFLIPHL